MTVAWQNEYQTQYPAHTCVDRPNLPCSACIKYERRQAQERRRKPRPRLCMVIVGALPWFLAVGLIALAVWEVWQWN